MNKLKKLIKDSTKSHTLIYDTTAFIFSKMGYGDINLAGQATRYKSFNKLKRKYAKIIGTTQFPEHKGDEKTRVWVCWLQGIENAPPLVKSCVKSIQHYIDEYEIVLLNKDNFTDYITLPDYIIEKWNKGIIPYAQFSDIVRLQLLIEHGGIWIDATTYFTGKMPNYIKDSDFFVYHDGFFNCELVNMGNWLIKSKCDNILLLETQNLLFNYWKDNNYLQHYFINHLFFRMVTDYYSDVWEAVPYYSQMNQHIFSKEIHKQYNEKRFEQIKEISTIHKLSYKLDADTLQENSYFSLIDKLFKQ